MLRKLLLSMLLAAMLAAGGMMVSVDARANGPEVFVERLGVDVVATLKDEGLAQDAKLKRLKILLDEATDLDLLAKLILGPHWRTASEDERQRYVATFRQLVNETMASRLGDYGGQTIDVVGSRELNERDSMVATVINRPDGQPAYDVDWRVRTTDGDSAVIDVIAEGVSMVVTQRSEIGAIVAAKGMEGLIETLEQRLAALSN